MYAIKTAQLHEQLSEMLIAPVFDLVTINGEHITDKQSFFNEFAEQLNFPDYFGFNWDAFADCMRDLSWLHGTGGLLLVYKNAHQFRTTHPEDWRVANDILLESVEYWQHRNTPLTVLFA